MLWMSIRNTQPAGLYVISGVTESIQIRIEHSREILIDWISVKRNEFLSIAQ